MTYFDYGVAGILGVSLLLGIMRGFVSEVLALAAWVLAAIAAKAFGAEVGQALLGGWVREPLIWTAGGVGVVFVAVLFLAGLAKLMLRGGIHALGLGPLDRLLGAIFGAARGGVIVLVLVAVGGMTQAPRAPWWQQSKLAPPLETVVLSLRPWLPSALAGQIRFYR